MKPSPESLGENQADMKPSPESLGKNLADMKPSPESLGENPLDMKPFPASLGENPDMKASLRNLGAATSLENGTPATAELSENLVIDLKSPDLNFSSIRNILEEKSVRCRFTLRATLENPSTIENLNIYPADMKAIRENPILLDIFLNPLMAENPSMLLAREE